MKVLHLFYDFQFLHSKVLISDMHHWKDELFNGKESEFWIIDCNSSEREKYYKVVNSEIFFFKSPAEAIFSFVKKTLRERSILIIHGGNYNIWLPLFFLPGFILSRVKWICWGSQLDYNLSSLRGWGYYQIRRRVFKKISSINFLISSEKKDFRKNGFNNKSVLFNPYFYSGYNTFLKINLPLQFSEKCIVRSVMLGNNGHAVNNHLKALDLLFLKGFNKKIILPLSYGYANYIEQVKNVSVNKFGNNVVFLENFLPISDLVLLFSETDSLIMYSDSQSGLFALYSYLFFLKPVFIKKGSRLDEYFKELGFKFFYLEEIIPEFQYEKNALIQNRSILEGLLNSKDSFVLWKKFFSDNAPPF